MGDNYGSKWMSSLPWVMLGRRTAFQPALQATPADLVFGETPAVPGDLVGDPGPLPTQVELQDMLQGLRQNASRPAIQTTHDGNPPSHSPDLTETSHFYVRRGKTVPLGPVYDGPFPVLKRLGDSCVKLGVGTFADGTPRTELQHLGNCKPAYTMPGTTDARRPALGRKALPKTRTITPANPVENTITPATPVDTPIETRVFTRSGCTSRPPDSLHL